MPNAQNTPTAGEWVRTEERLPRDVPGEQVSILMWSPEWATWVHGMFTCWGTADFEWSTYDSLQDRFFECLETPEWWCEVRTPDTDGKE